MENTKIWYEITKDRFEYRLGSRTQVNLSEREIYDIATSPDRFEKVLERYESEAEARKAFESYKAYASTRLERGYIGWLLTGEVYSLEVNEYWVDEDGEEDFSQQLGCDSWAEPYIGIKDEEGEE